MKFSVFYCLQCCGMLATAQNPYPLAAGLCCRDVTCSDVDPGQGSCHGSLPYVIVTPSKRDRKRFWRILPH